jgi:hypothetical protein
MTYSELTSGKYKPLIEPLAFCKYNGTEYVGTAHEYALLDDDKSGAVRKSVINSVTHRNLPLALFLTEDDLGFKAWEGSKTDYMTTAQVKKYGGLGIVSWAPPPPPPPPPVLPAEAAFTYRTDTDVITPITITAGEDITPTNPLAATFTVSGIGTYQMTNVVIPKNGSQVVWCKWHTPSTPGTVPITMTTNFGSTVNITATVVNLAENPPPDPRPEDTAQTSALPRAASGMKFSIPAAPETNAAQKSWSVWSATAVSYYDPYYDDEDDEWKQVLKWRWDYHKAEYTAKLASTFAIAPSLHVPTAAGDQMKSGYGVTALITPTVSSSAPGSHFTKGQNAITYFPEFTYGTYNRLLERVASGNLRFKANKYSTYNDNVHFTPLWYPDGTYRVRAYVRDAWTPAGELTQYINDTVTIQGAVFDDWHVRPIS